MRVYNFFIALFLAVAIAAGFAFVNPPFAFKWVLSGVVGGALFLVLALLVDSPSTEASIFFFLSAVGWLHATGAVIGFVKYYPHKYPVLGWALVFSLFAYICISFGAKELKRAKEENEEVALKKKLKNKNKYRPYD